LLCRTNCDESISTLKFADRAKQVMVQAVINETRPVDYALVKRLQEEVEMLKSMLRRLVQQQGGIINSSSINTLGFQIKQATSTSEIQDLLCTTPSNELPSNKQLIATTLSPGSLRLNGTEGIAATSSGSKDTEEVTESSGGLAYIIALEKSLNQEQIHSKHLAQKNSTLIKELEELKFHNLKMINDRSGNTGNGNRSSGDPIPPHAITKSLSINNLAISPSQVAQVIESVRALQTENAKLHENIDNVQKTLKKFFKFQIEEDDMKQKLEAVSTYLENVFLLLF
jgi:hypothetical protein